MNRNVYTTSSYIYKSTASGISVYDLETEALLNYVTIVSGTNAVWANDQYVYIATCHSGIYYCPVSTVTGTAIFTEYKSWPNLTSNTVNYIHGGGDYLCVVTNSGVDNYKISTDTRRSEIISSADKCFQASSGDYYYSVNLPTTTKLYAKYNSGGSYTYTSSAIHDATKINDIFVTENTSAYGNANVLFLATDNGAVVLEEKRNDESNCRKRIYLIAT